jgi:hypothetical protein
MGMRVAGKVIIILSSFSLLTYVYIIHSACTNPVINGSGDRSPRDFQVTFAEPDVNLTWGHSERNEETGYEILRSEGDNDNYAIIATTDRDVTSYSDTSLELGKTYYYKVGTVYGDNGGGFSAEVGIFTSYFIWSAIQYLYDPDAGIYVRKLYKFDATSGEPVGGFYIIRPYNGLTWDGTYLWGTSSSNDVIYKHHPASGRVITSFDAPGLWSHGLAWDGNHLWYADAYLDTIYKLNPDNGEVITSFPAPCPDPSGLAWDGDYLWNSDSRYRFVYKLDPTTGEVISSIRVPYESPKGIGWDGEYLWYVWRDYDINGDSILKIDPVTGTLLNSIPIPPPYSTTGGLCVQISYETIDG